MSHLLTYNFCKVCGVELTKEEAEERISKGKIPLCEKHAIEIDTKLLQWLPLMQLLNPSSGKSTRKK